MTTQPSSPAPDRRGFSALARSIPRRPRVGILAGLLLAIGFATVVTPTIAIDTWLVQLGKLAVAPDARADITVRVPPFAGSRSGSFDVKGGGILVARGEAFGRDRAAAVAEIYAATPRGVAPYLAYFLLCATLVAIYAHHLRRSNHGRLLRVQIINLLTLAGIAVVTKIALLTTSVSVLAVPVALAAIIPTLVFDRIVGLATGVLSALVVSFLVPFDVGVATVLLAQAATAGLLVPEAPKRPLRAALLAGLAAAGVSAFTYGVLCFLTTGVVPIAELATPAASPWVAATAGGLLAVGLTTPLLPLYQLLVGEITSSRLTQLQDLSHPLLRQISEKSPGTWQHSLAMANMAEIAANAIGASGRLVRVGAYYHDLGKSLQPKYFIENIEPGEASPHEHLPPEVSCDAIFAHVTEGIVTARRAKLHERVIDFMHMHHGNGVLEYFWTKCQRQGNPSNLSAEAFRYPGVPPQSRETAILAICDAVEAAARTLKKPDPASIDQLVQRIVYGKLHLGQLDESGLSMGDLRRISDSLRETIRHAHHGRIEYPWQEQARAAEGSGPLGERGEPPRLDSLDAPRPPWHAKPTTADGRPRSEAEELAVATTAVGRGERRGAQTPAPPADDGRDLRAPAPGGADAPDGRDPRAPAPGGADADDGRDLRAPASGGADARADNLGATAPGGADARARADSGLRATAPGGADSGGLHATAPGVADARADSGRLRATLPGAAGRGSVPGLPAVPPGATSVPPGATEVPPASPSAVESSAILEISAAEPRRTSGLADDPGAHMTRRGVGPPPAPRSTGAHAALPTGAEPTASDPAVTLPRMPAAGAIDPSSAGRPIPPVSAVLDLPPRPLAESSLAQRIDASLAAMGDDEAADLVDLPFHADDLPPRPVRREPTVVTSAPRAPAPGQLPEVTSPAHPAYPSDADVTSQQPLAELEELVARSMPSRTTIRTHPPTHEVEPEDIEAAIEVAPPRRRDREASVVQRLPRAPKKPSR
ncbi:MAG: HDIG domain-containing protein [Kofleriaceae bacterium]